MRTTLAGFAIAVAATVALVPGTAVAAEAPPPTCDRSEWWAIDPDCVSLTFTQQPPTSTQSTQATIAWVAKVAEADKVAAGSTDVSSDDWSEWRDKVCTLKGPGDATRDIPCADAPNANLSGLTPGSYVFTVTAVTPDFGEQFFDTAAAGGTDATVEPCDDESSPEIPGQYTCYRVSGQVAWTVLQPDPAPAPVVTTEAPAPVVAAAPAATPRQCTSRRTLTIRIRERKGERVRSARVVFNGKTIATSRRTSDGRLVASIDFRKLPAGRFAVQIRASLQNGKTRTYTRRYFTCEPKRPPSNNLESPKSL